MKTSKVAWGTLIVLSLLLIMASSALAAPAGPSASVNVAALNVRQGPGTNYGVISVVHLGDSLGISGQNTAAGWYQIALPDGRSGWVKGDFVQVIGDASSIPEVAGPAAGAVTASASASLGSHVIVFQTASGGPIYAMNPDGSGLRYLTNGIDPALSADGKTVAFTRWTVGNGPGALGSVWLINADGTNERVLLNDVTAPKSPTWSPDGTQIAINMQQGGTLNDTILSRGCRPFSQGDNVPPGFTTNGNQICPFIPADPYWGLRLINVADGSFQDLPRDRHSFAPAWDPANAWHLVYQGDHGLVNLDLNQKSTWALTSNSDQRGPVFSPDGSKIAVTFHQNDHWEVHVMNADGSSEVRLTETPLTTIVDAQIQGQQPRIWNNAAPAWSPDGSQIAFLSDRNGQWEIWAMNPDGSNQYVLVPASALGGASIRYDGVDERVLTWR